MTGIGSHIVNPEDRFNGGIMKLLLALFITVLVGCDLFNEDTEYTDETEDTEVLYVFREMQCVEYLWGSSSDDETWSEIVRAYLEIEGITVNRIEALRDSLGHCAACEICATGRTIEVWIDESDAYLMNGLEFVESG